MSGPTSRTTLNSGLAYGVTGFTIWGLAPLYWRQLAQAGPWEVMVYRIGGTAVLAALILWFSRKLPGVVRSLHDPRVRRDLLFSSLLIGANWTCFVWAVMSGRVIETSLGYYLCPLVMIALGVFVLKETITPAKIAAVGLAAVGVASLMFGLHVLPWVPVFLAVTFGLYGFVRKRVAINALEGVFVETMFWLVPSLAVLWFLPHAGHHTGTQWGLLLFAGPFTLLPLVCYTQSARRVRLTTLGFLQYTSPTLSLLLAVFVFHEPLTRAHMIAFAAIWLGIAIFTWDSARAVKPAQKALEVA